MGLFKDATGKVEKGIPDIKKINLPDIKFKLYLHVNMQKQRRAAIFSSRINTPLLLNLGKISEHKIKGCSRDLPIPGLER